MPLKYRGRFAPSPTGPLHFGSLVAALASYLDAKKHDGDWIIRIEDVDGSRCRTEYTRSIVDTLSSYSLDSDAPIIEQSSHTELYEAHLQKLKNFGRVFKCACTRKSLKPHHGKHPFICSSEKSAFKNSFSPESNKDNLSQSSIGLASLDSWRLSTNSDARFTINDPIQGTISFDVNTLNNHPILKRKDGYFSYQLAVVVDDHLQNITHLVRGSDLLDTTTEQLYIYSLFGWIAPQMTHIPVIIDENGNKISKQNHAKPLLNGDIKTIKAALRYLEIRNCETLQTIPALLDHAISVWTPNRIPQSKTLPLRPEDYWLIR